MKSSPTILFIDQEKKSISPLFSHLKECFAYSFQHIISTHDLTLRLRQTSPDIVFIDVTFEGREKGLKLLNKLGKNNKVVLIPVVPQNDNHVLSEVINCSPFFYITKPYDPAEVTLALKRAVEKHRFSKQSKNNISDQHNYCGIIGNSPSMLELFNLISKVAEDDVSTVLIRGESGTGKELVAKAIHTKSRRNTGKFVPVNCAAIPDDLLESELFGHVKGAFTGATQTKQGRIQYAEGGTLFLDEIGDMKPSLQAKLLRVLQEKEFEPVGGLQSTPVDTRIVAATHCDLETLVQEGTFREDLYYRLSVIPLNIPPLTSRKEDIPLLIENFVKRYSVERGREPFRFSKDALQTLLRYNWKGNVRELENVIQHMSILYSGKTVEKSDLPEKFNSEENVIDEDVSHLLSGSTSETASYEAPSSIEEFFTEISFAENEEVDFYEIVNAFEKKLIIGALRATQGNKKEAAKLLRLKRTTLLEKIKKKQLSPDHW